MENNKNYMKGFVPYAVAAAILSLCGGFTASVPTAISTAWNADASLTFITLAYSLAAAAMAPIMGKLGGAIGRRKMLLSAMGLYTVGQALIAICPQNVPLLLVFRFMVGIGAAGIAPVVMSYIMMEFPPEKMGQGFTIYMALACGMVIFGPTLGGIVMKVIGTASAWRIVMWICVALCVISFLICFAKVKDNPNIPKGSMKGRGAETHPQRDQSGTGAAVRGPAPRKAAHADQQRPFLYLCVPVAQQRPQHRLGR